MKNITFGKTGRKIPASIFETPEELGEKLAAEILAKCEEARNRNRLFLLGCPSGRSLQSTYNAIAEKAAVKKPGLSNLVFVMMDEYVFKTDEGFKNCPDNAHYSCHRFAKENMMNLINKELAEQQKIKNENVWFPDPSNPTQYEKCIEKAGGINIFLIASGATDGHVAFNPQGTSQDSETRVIELAEITRKDNLKTFPDFKDLSEVPKYGVSVGLGTISGLSLEVVLVIHGTNKQEAVKKLSKCDAFTPDWPASIIFQCNKSRIFLDNASAGI